MNQNAPFVAGQRKVSLEQAFQLAAEHHQQGRLPQAEQLAMEILKQNPQFAEAWQLRAVIANQVGNRQAALELMTRAIRQAPTVALFYANRAEIQRQAGKLDAAEADARQAILLDARLPQAHNNLGVTLYDKEDFDGAEAAQKEALKLQPAFPQALNNLGSICRERQDRDKAEEYYRRALELAPDYLEPVNNLGAVLLEQGHPEDSAQMLQELVARMPNYGEAQSNLGNAFAALEDFAQAEKAYRQALEVRADHVEAIEGLARCASEARDYDKALQLVAQAMEVKPGRAKSYVLRASIRSEQGFPDLAMAAYDTALEMDPESAGAWAGKSHILMENGDMEGAESAILKAHELDPEALGPRLALAHCRKVKEGDDNLLALEGKAKEMAEMSPIMRIPLHFALGKSYEDLKRYDEAMENFIKGCELKRQRVQYSADNQDALAANIQRVFTPERLEQLSGGGASSDLPIFVLGMPRSGTTLTETIIASHPQVYGAGELPDLMQLCAQPLAASNPGYPLNCEDLSADALLRLGATYVEQLRARAPEARHITDKMPANFQVLGLIHLMLPNAKIIHIKRNPVDTCVSNFTKLFSRSQFQSYDMTELGRFYRNYLDIMAHWRSLLPQGSFYEVQYEQLVANQEEETRKLIDYCGLDWDDACMTPHKTERNIKTASVTQVRQPVYTSSVERWRRYEKHLDPLLEALGDALSS